MAEVHRAPDRCVGTPAVTHAHHECTHSPNESITAAPHAIVNSQRMEIGLGKETLAVVLLLSVVIGACALIMGLNLSKQDRQDESFRAMKTQMWLVERRLMDREALDIINGQRLPSDTEFGPTGNLQRMKPKEQSSGR